MAEPAGAAQQNFFSPRPTIPSLESGGFTKLQQHRIQPPDASCNSIGSNHSIGSGNGHEATDGGGMQQVASHGRVPLQVQRRASSSTQLQDSN
eukprot:5701903-Pleurochrysis_carterae.AAC.3